MISGLMPVAEIQFRNDPAAEQLNNCGRRWRTEPVAAPIVVRMPADSGKTSATRGTA
jgi:pyruvate/2-oxoglutarate/acetoin dehydrogenase E1 component